MAIGTRAVPAEPQLGHAPPIRVVGPSPSVCIVTATSQITLPFSGLLQHSMQSKHNICMSGNVTVKPINAFN